MKRIVAVIKFLGSRGLAFRGANQTCGSTQNGNFLGLLDLLSEFDPLIASHIAKYGNKGKGIMYFRNILSELNLNELLSKLKPTPGQASYLSDTICDEFIDLIGSKALDVILTEMKESKYFYKMVSKIKCRQCSKWQYFSSESRIVANYQ